LKQVDILLRYYNVLFDKYHEDHRIILAKTQEFKRYFNIGGWAGGLVGTEDIMGAHLNNLVEAINGKVNAKIDCGNCNTKCPSTDISSDDGGRAAKTKKHGGGKNDEERKKQKEKDKRKIERLKVFIKKGRTLKKIIETFEGLGVYENIETIYNIFIRLIVTMTEMNLNSLNAAGDIKYVSEIKAEFQSLQEIKGDLRTSYDKILKSDLQLLKFSNYFAMKDKAISEYESPSVNIFEIDNEVVKNAVQTFIDSNDLIIDNHEEKLQTLTDSYPLGDDDNECDNVICDKNENESKNESCDMKEEREYGILRDGILREDILIDGIRDDGLFGNIVLTDDQYGLSMLGPEAVAQQAVAQQAVAQQAVAQKYLVDEQVVGEEQLNEMLQEILEDDARLSLNMRFTPSEERQAAAQLFTEGQGLGASMNMEEVPSNERAGDTSEQSEQSKQMREILLDSSIAPDQYAEGSQSARKASAMSPMSPKGGSSILFGGNKKNLYNKNIPKTAPASKPKTAPASKPKTAPATKPKTAPASKPKTAPASKPKTAPATKPKTTKETKPKTASVSKPKTAPATKPKTTPATKPKTTKESKPKTTKETKPKTASVSKPKTASVSKPKTAPATKPKTTKESKPKTTKETKPKTASVSKPKTAPASKPKTTPVSKPKTAPATKPKTAPTTKPKTTPVTKPKTTPVTKPKTAPTTKPKTAPVSKPKTAPATKPKTANATKPKTAPVSNPK